MITYRSSPLFRRSLTCIARRSCRRCPGAALVMHGRLFLPPFLALPNSIRRALRRFGVQSPYLPSLLERRNLTPEATATLLAAGTAIRLVAGPAAGRLADIIDAPKAVLAACSAAAALIALGYLQATGIWLLFLVGVFHSAALAPLAPLTDTLALGSAAPGPSEGAAQRRFHYRWLRGAGSAAFICGTLLFGQAIARVATRCTTALP